MLNLMAHNPGWEDSGLGHLFGNKADAVPDFREYMKTHQPDRVRPPGLVSAYSNYGTALAGLIISNISGMVFEDYIDQNILGPLGMNNSTFRETWTNIDVDPMPERMVKNRSNGYVWKNGGFEAQPMEYIHQVGAAGSMSVTATDMARWMLMHLGDGTYDGVQILAPETAPSDARAALRPRRGDARDGPRLSRVPGPRLPRLRTTPAAPRSSSRRW